MLKTIIVGSNHTSTAEYYKKINVDPSVLVLSTEQVYTVGHTAIQDIPDYHDMEFILSRADQVFWAECSAAEFSSSDSYYDFLYWLQLYNLKFNNVKNIHTISFDPYAWNTAIPTMTEDDIVFFGGSITAGVGLSDPNTWYSNIIADHFKKHSINLAQTPGINNNTKTFDLFTQTKFVPGQIVIMQITPLERIRYCNEQTGLLEDLQFSTVKGQRELLEVYHRQFLFYNLLLYTRAMINVARTNKLRFVMFHDNYKLGPAIEEQLYFYQYPEFVPKTLLQDYNIDCAEDNIHPGIKSNQFIAHTIIDYINTIYK